MKKIINFIFILPLMLLCSCGGGNEENLEQDIPTLQLKDICGVWVDSSNKLYYISINQNGRYTYCLNDKLIGSGKCTLEKNTLVLNDDYVYSSDLITINKLNNKLSMQGKVSKMNSSKESINKQFVLSESEQYSPSISGVNKTATGGLNKYYDNLKQEINFISDVIFEYKYTGRKKGTLDYKTISQYTWRYVYRKPYTYGIQINSENANVEIFDFPFIYEPNWVPLWLDLDDFRVQ